MNHALRCPSRIHGVIVSDDATGTLEVKCSSSHCGAGRGVVVLHSFELSNQQLVETRRFRSPSVTAVHDYKERQQ